MKSAWKTLAELFEVLPKGAKPFYTWYAIATGALALLDTLALALIVAVITPLASGDPISLPIVGELPSNAVLWIAIAVAVLFVSKGVIASILHWHATRRFARYELEVGDALFRAYTRSSWERRSQVSTATVTRIVDTSMSHTNTGFIMPLSQVPVNALTFVSVLSVLIVAQPLVALIAFVYLGCALVLMTSLVSKHSRSAGARNRTYGYRVATIMTEMVDALKEIVLRGKLDEVGEVLTENRQITTRARANLAFLSVVPKYAYEAVLVGGVLIVGGSAYLIGGTTHALVAISLFAATGFRMIPALNAVQSSINSASATEPYARDVIRELKSANEESAEMVEQPDTGELPAAPTSLKLTEVSFRYPGAERDVLTGLSLSIPLGSSLAIVGPSGAGKSTLIDILLGLSVPTSGALEIDGVPLESVMRQWRGRVGYVPQRVALFDASIAQNVALTWHDDYDADRVEEALNKAHLSELITRGDGIRTTVGERGTSISGGQQQRMGIARALYADPFVMVMDEATSSLDTATENKITESLNELQGEVTFITVAHRLATIRDYDQVCYLDQGKILGQGAFMEVVEQVPEFKVQAQLAGIL